MGVLPGPRSSLAQTPFQPPPSTPTRGLRGHGSSCLPSCPAAPSPWPAVPRGRRPRPTPLGQLTAQPKGPPMQTLAAAAAVTCQIRPRRRRRRLSRPPAAPPAALAAPRAPAPRTHQDLLSVQAAAREACEQRGKGPSCAPPTARAPFAPRLATHSAPEPSGGGGRKRRCPTALSALISPSALALVAAPSPWPPAGAATALGVLLLREIRPRGQEVFCGERRGNQ